MINRRLIVAGLSLLLPARCADPIAPEGRLVTRLALDRVALAPGDTARATVIVTNASPFSVTITGSSTCLIGVTIFREASGELVHPRGQACTADLTPLPFGPGESHVRSFIWTAERYAYIDHELRKFPEPPGRYRIVAGLGRAPDLTRTSEPQWIDVVLR